ncbi:cobalamin biosynthesis protein CobD [Clostridium pasteurianum BC1]|uniref:Cobalamin biosynthesis protein CobD n=2 Tax=Clostridium pasteurianum TaxID=1501 RepID=R4K374_CLOPA|nr:adenosylcobinamide-phosphate synthase CbiB [Clostridium pasteurianum]AGK96196.1 cobalamin biosynthesis protein CobD [Clostridium pasteurianum BC1]
MYTALDIVLAVILDFILGDPRWLPHPIIYIGKIISFLEKKARKFSRNNNQLRLFGALIVIVVGSISFIIPFCVLEIVKSFIILHHILNVLIIWTTLAAKSLNIAAMKVHTSLQNKDIKDARIKLSYIVGRDTKELSEEKIIRADVETVAENTSDGVIAPIIFAMIGGAPLAMLYKGINTMDSMLGYKNKKYYYIGFFPAKTDDLFNLIPARITGILIALVSPLVKGNILESLKIMIRDRKNHKSPNCAYPEAAAAGAMKIQLGGTNSYFGELVYKPTLGDKKQNLDKKHIKEVIKLMYGSEILLLIIYVIVVYLKVII